MDVANDSLFKLDVLTLSLNSVRVFYWRHYSTTMATAWSRKWRCSGVWGTYGRSTGRISVDKLKQPTKV